MALLRQVRLTDHLEEAISEHNLTWPPEKETLERLYVSEGLSAMKIAQRYNLQYDNPKSGESMIFYYMRRFGITRRDPASHIRKVTQEMEDEWVRRYELGESLKQIAGTTIDPVTVFNHLHKRGVHLRDKVEAQIRAVTKLQKSPFDGTLEDKAYLLGFARGDLNAIRHGRAIRIRTSSTHPAMIELVTSLFAHYGAVRAYPRFSKLVGYEWSVEGELDKSFEFLIQEKLNTPNGREITRLIMSYLAGLFDAEGSTWLRLDREFEPRMSFANKDVDLLEWVKDSLSKLGFHPWLSRPDRHGVYHVHLWRVEVNQVLRALPLRHPERKAKARLLDSDKNWSEYRSDWLRLKKSLDYDRTEFVRLAAFLVERKSGPTVLSSGST